MHATHKPFLHSLSCLIACLTLAATALAADIGPADALVAKDNVTKDKAAKDKAAPPLSKEARQQITRYRMARKPAQRAAAIVNLVALGDEGKTAAKELFEKELKLAEPAVRAAQQPTKFDAPLEKLRKVLAGLREDPNLTKDQLKNVGLPTLEELTAVYGQWTRATAGRTAKAGRVVAQLNEMVAVLKALQDKWPLDAPIPVNDYLNQSRGQLDKLSGKDDEEAKKVLAENRARAAKFPADLRSGMDEVNAVRIVCGLRPLLYDEKLCAAAIEHSTDMETHNYFSHEAPRRKKRRPGTEPSWPARRLPARTSSKAQTTPTVPSRAGSSAPGTTRTCSPIRPSGKVLAAPVRSGRRCSGVEASRRSVLEKDVGTTPESAPRRCPCRRWGCGRSCSSDRRSAAATARRGAACGRRRS